MVQNKKSKIIFGIVILIVLSLIFWFFYYFNKPFYTNEYFNIPRLKSEVDRNKNGIDDYEDILVGAKIDAKNHPKYDGRYWETGYPPDNIGVCTDVIWRAFKNAGYNLRAMVDNDIRNNQEYYQIKTPDKNIDFRRVRNLYLFFKKYAENLTTDITDIALWQAGDIVVFHENTKHIGIISDKRNKKGIPYLIHNSGQLNREEDILEFLNKRHTISGHFRFNAKNIPEILRDWEEEN